MFKPLILLFLAFSIHAQDSLVQYYNGVITLSPAEIQALSIDKIGSENQYDRALGFYELGLLSRKDRDNLQAWVYYNEAYRSLLKSDTSEYILQSAILRNQGNIAAAFGLYDIAIEKYREALPATRKCDELDFGNYANYSSRELSTLYNIGWARKKEKNHAESIKVFHEIKDKADPTSMDYMRAYREMGILYKEMEMYDDANAHFDYAASTDYKASNRDYKLMWVYHEWADLHKEMGDYAKQEELLNKALELSPHFTTKLDLGESYMLQGREEEALVILTSIQDEYYSRPLNGDNIKLFDFLHELEPSNVEYAVIGRDEYKKYAIEQEKIKEESNSIAFRKAIEEIEKEFVYQNTINQLWKYVGYAILVAFFIAVFFIVRGKLLRNRRRKDFRKLFDKVIKE